MARAAGVAANWAATASAARPGFAGNLVGRVRVDADGELHVRPERREPLRLRGLRRITGGEHHQRAVDPRRSRADDLVQVRGEDRIREMAV